MIDLIEDTLLEPHTIDPRYEDSPFRNIKLMDAKTKGKRYEQITECVLTKLGHTVTPPQNTQHDRIVDGIKVEIKGSTLRKNLNDFTFLQIRPDDDYDELIFTLCYPHELYIYKMDKATVRANIESKTFSKQHGGKGRSSGTYCYYGTKETLEEIGAVRI
jgi:hypothetical protein